jgi:hypothetical protein
VAGAGFFYLIMELIRVGNFRASILAWTKVKYLSKADTAKVETDGQSVPSINYL